MELKKPTLRAPCLGISYHDIQRQIQRSMISCNDVLGREPRVLRQHVRQVRGMRFWKCAASPKARIRI